MAFVQIGGVEIYYEIHGHGRPVVLVAGYTCDCTFWQGVLPALAKRFQVIVFDNRGIARTKDDGRPFSIEMMAADTAALIKHLGLSRPAIIGQSMGGAIVQTMLTRFPEVCGQCGILNSTQKFDAVAIKALESLLALRKADVGFDLLIDMTLPWLSGSEWLSRPRNVARFKAALRANPVPQSIADQERQLKAIKSFDARMWDKPWIYPAFVVSAAEDRVTSLQEGKMLAESLGAKFVEVRGGHATPIEQSERLSQILVEALE